MVQVYIQTVKKWKNLVVLQYIRLDIMMVFVYYYSWMELKFQQFQEISDCFGKN